MRRRDVLKGGLGLAATVLSSRAWAVPDVTKRRLPIPPIVESHDGDPIELVMKAGRQQILPGALTETVGFNGPYLGPTVRVRDGQDVPITYRNALKESVAVHAHGLHVSGDVDGGPQRLIAPGESWAPVLPIRQRASTSWYHPHTHGRTGSQVYRGLAGFFFIDDENSDSLPLPKTYGVDDLPLVVQDRTLDDAGRLVYDPTDDEDGFLADTITVNGIAHAAASVPAGLVRLRILNGSNARFYRFRFADGRVFHKIASDGGFLERPVPIRDMVMVPGERNEIVVDFSDGRSAQLVSANTEFRGASRWSWDERRGRDDWQGWGPGGLGDAFEILELTVDARPAARTELPERLSAIQRPAPSRDWPRRRFELNMDIEDDDRGGRGHDTHMSMGINGRAMDFAVINERVRRGQWEHWHIDANDGHHPFHIHGCSFLVLSMDGDSVSDEDAGWKDTVWVDDKVDLVVRFNHEATEKFPYMYHCHILEHEDHGMMGQCTVT